MGTQLAHDVRGTGARAVLAHGFTQTGRSWAAIADRLASFHQVVTVDLPGHGDSGAVRADLPESAALMGAVGGQAAYVGYSMGGRVALHLALCRPELVDRLVLIGATGGLDTAEERVQRIAADEALARGLERDGVDEFLDRWLRNPLFERLPHDQAALNDRRRNTVDGLASSLRLTGTGTQEPLWGRLHAIDVPVLVLAGEHDPKFRALGERLTGSIGSNATFTVIPEAGHAAHLERPDEVGAELLAFLHEGQTERQQ